MKAKLTGQLRRAIRESGVSGYAICKATGIDKAALSRFMAGKVGLSAASIDAVGEFLELELVSKRKGARQ